MPFIYPIYVGFFQRAEDANVHFIRESGTGILQPACSTGLNEEQLQSASKHVKVDIGIVRSKSTKHGYLVFDGYHITQPEVALIQFLIAEYGCEVVEFCRYSFANFSDLKRRLGIV